VIERFLDYVMPTVLQIAFGVVVIGLAMMFLFVTIGPEPPKGDR